MSKSVERRQAIQAGMSIGDYMMMVESIASCALAGDKYAEETLALKDKDHKEFMTRVYALHLKALEESKQET